MTVTPTLKVEISFAYNPVEPYPTWTDVSAYVRSGHVTRGRSNELTAFSAGTCEIVLDNRDRRFDPTNLTGPYVDAGGNSMVLPRNQIRVKATYNAIEYPIFQGFVAAWPQERDISNRDAVATVQCVDGLAYLAATDLGPDCYSSYLNTLSPQAIFPLGDDGATQIDIQGQRNFTTTADLAHSDTSMTQYMVGNPSSFDTIAYGLAALPVTTTGAFSIVAWIRSTSLGPRGIIEGSGGARLQIDGFGLAHYYADTTAVVNSAGSVIGGGSTMICVTHDASSGVALPVMYVNGADASAGAVAGLAGSQDWNILGSGTAPTVPFSGPIQHISVFPQVLSAGEVYSLYYNAITAWALQPTYVQVNAVLDFAGWPDDAILPYGPSAFRYLSAQSIASPDFIQTGSNALDVIQKIVASEQGQFFISNAGVATLRGGWDLYDVTNHARNAVSQFTFSDDNAAGTVGYASAGFDLDDSFLVNTVEAKTSSGQSVYAKNAVSEYAFGKRSVTIETRLVTPLEAQNAANLRLSRYAVPTPRLRAFAVTPQANPTVEFPKMLNLDLQDRVTVRSQPLNIGTVSNREYWVEGISHTFEPGKWECQVACSQVPGSDYWQLDTDAFVGVSTVLK